ncbi:MAG TPA: GNAT family N-acetyltransferase [Dehalococcoidia bacterium]
MPDLLVRLYALSDTHRYDARVAESGISVRRAEAWDRVPLRRFVNQNFGENWASEADLSFSTGHPISAFVAMKDGHIVGFAAFESTRRGFFGPTGVREDLRGNGAGAVLLLRCLEAMQQIGYAYAVIGGVGPARFYELVCGATVIDGSDPGVYGDLYREQALRTRHPQ